MADEITVQAIIRAKNGSFNFNYQTGAIKVDQTAVGQAGGIYGITTYEETLEFGDLANPGYFIFRNVGDAGVITLGPDDGMGSMVAALSLNPGDVAMGRLDPNSVWIASASEDAKLEIQILED